MPEYNGAIEASIGGAKKRTERSSEVAGRPGQWLSSDLDSARLEANTLTHPRRLHGLTAQQTWDARPPLTLEARARFDATVAQLQTEARVERGLLIDEPLPRAEQAAVVVKRMRQVSGRSAARGRGQRARGPASRAGPFMTQTYFHE